MEPNIATEHQPCSCYHCQAMDRLYALADVFEQAGDYAAADCCAEWAQRAGRKDPLGQQMVAALMRGERPAEWSDTR